MVTGPRVFLPITQWAGGRPSSRPALLSRFMIKVQAQYAVNLVGILVAYLGRSPIKLLSPVPLNAQRQGRFPPADAEEHRKNDNGCRHDEPGKYPGQARRAAEGAHPKGQQQAELRCHRR